MNYRKLIVRTCSIVLGFVLAISIAACRAENEEMTTATKETMVYTPNEAANFDNIVVNGESLYIGLTLNDMVAEGVDFGKLDVESIAMPEFKKMLDVTFRGVKLKMLVENSKTEGIALGETQVVQIYVQEKNLKDTDTVVISTIDIRSSLNDAEEKLGMPTSTLCGDGFTTDGWKKEIEGKNKVVELYFTHDANGDGNSATIAVGIPYND